MLVKELLTNALYLSLYDREFQPSIPGGKTTAALGAFNLMLDEFRDVIPYQFVSNFTDVADLTDTSFVSVDQVSFIINTVVFPLEA